MDARARKRFRLYRGGHDEMIRYSVRIGYLDATWNGKDVKGFGA